MTSPHEPSFLVRQQPDRLDRRKLVAISVLMAVAFGVSMVAAAVLLRANEAGRDVGPTPAPPAQIGGVETTLFLATERGITMRQRQRAALDQYEWIDRDAGRARIPIDRAMDLLVERGVSNDGGALP